MTQYMSTMSFNFEIREPVYKAGKFRGITLCTFSMHFRLSDIGFYRIHLPKKQKAKKHQLKKPIG